ncbi:hypothetical protein JW906_15245 [bacterium]|nr:hypothetical protein [bacterium]
MRRIARVSGRIALFTGLVLILMGVLAWPPGGLMFALPFVFLIPGILLAAAGGLLLRAGRRRQ